jgi:hypothetical protein
MNLTVKSADTCPVGARVSRIVLKKCALLKDGTASFVKYRSQSDDIVITNDEAISIDATYTPVNKVLSVVVGHRRGNERANVFGTTTEFGIVPAYFCFRLPGGRYIELYIDDN